MTESSRAFLPLLPRECESLSQTPGSQVGHVHTRGIARFLTVMPAATGLVRGTGRHRNHHHHRRYVPAFFEVRRLSNSEKSSLIVPFKLLKRSKAPGERAAVAVRCLHFSAMCFPIGGDQRWAGVCSPHGGEPGESGGSGGVGSLGGQGRHREGPPHAEQGSRLPLPHLPLPKLKPRGQGAGGSPEGDAGLAADAAAQGSAAFPALGAGCCGAAQGSEPLGTERVPAPVGTPHGSTEVAGLAPVGRWGRFRDAPRKGWAARVRGRGPGATGAPWGEPPRPPPRQSLPGSVLPARTQQTRGAAWRGIKQTAVR